MGQISQHVKAPGVSPAAYWSMMPLDKCTYGLPNKINQSDTAETSLKVLNADYMYETSSLWPPIVRRPVRYLLLLIWLVLAGDFCSAGLRLWPQLSYEFLSDRLGVPETFCGHAGLIRISGAAWRPPRLTDHVVLIQSGGGTREGWRDWVKGTAAWGEVGEWWGAGKMAEKKQQPRVK